ncbi:hypothetical protein J7K42_01465 [bacterium]|nr:hypothetical protein [bacterium]
MSKKIALLFLIVFLGGLFSPLVGLAGTYQADTKEVYYRGLVPCGKKVCVSGSFSKEEIKEIEESLANNESFEVACRKGGGTLTNEAIYCQFCHFFVMIDGIFDFVLINIVPPIAVLMLVIGGIMFYFAGGRPELISRGKSLIKAVVIGLFLAYGSFMIVGTLLKIVGVADWTRLQNFIDNGVFTINCEIEL